MFQSTHPRKVRPTCTRRFFQKFLFQSTHPRKVRPDELEKIESFARFNPRTHERCDQTRFNYTPPEGEFQSTHPRKVRRDPRTDIFAVIDVSIHAPTKGATYVSKSCLAKVRSFNPRTHERCDKIYRKGTWSRQRFNPRTHERCDLDVCLRSVHAPGFNPRTHERCDYPI